LAPGCREGSEGLGGTKGLADLAASGFCKGGDCLMGITLWQTNIAIENDHL